MSDFFDVALSRRSVKIYDPAAEISTDELTALLETAGRAPSAWNLQQWHFLVFHGKDVQEKLLPIAYNQKQIVDASAVICILGDLEGYHNIDPVFDPQVEANEMTPELKEILAGQINGAYKHAEYPRDGAILNSSLAAMQFMLAARAKGFDTCPIGGFNASALVETFNVSKRYLPTMLITIGRKLQEGRPTDRIPVKNLITYAK
ncbi:nitroreductase family protein [Domibacillus epiphyticus]|uniref:Nitroreductase family protein n=1 Tax=Domibacillus epiphyticus TaxID=1714355 RepID=A0A1V2A8L8_9BACI|nr:nitroreductase family protein [Domibacillus epiphyticus]OMP67164.1 nitroreductase family protein [Domibacillus epiphyticus]